MPRQRPIGHRYIYRNTTAKSPRYAVRMRIGDKRYNFGTYNDIRKAGRVAKEVWKILQPKLGVAAALEQRAARAARMELAQELSQKYRTEALKDLI